MKQSDIIKKFKLPDNATISYKKDKVILYNFYVYNKNDVGGYGASYLKGFLYKDGKKLSISSDYYEIAQALEFVLGPSEKFVE